MDRLDAMRLFVRVVERGSFSSVAREAGVGQSAVSKQIAALEAHLGAQLLRRTSRSMTLTDAGQVFYESALRVVDEFDAAESLVGHGQSAPSGLVRVTVAPVFGRLYIVPRLPEFFARYPDISIELTGSGRNINLIEEGVDLAIRNGELTDSSMIGRRIATAPFATVATPAYLAVHGVPLTPSDLDVHACLIFAPLHEPLPWEFRDGARTLLHHPRANFRTADAEQIRAAVLAGLGLAHSPAWAFAPEIASGAVRVVLADYAPGPLAISAVHPAGRRLPTKVQVFIDFLAEILAGDAGLTGHAG
ncbi:LysR family transcriptional regulator [Caballeronia udeis]|uniref:LysR family transcriptional regulator n=1 Tax=Caballeronia udeis TaxID=1232866 RepID=A0A158FL81_9BURK|nr:LysR family transcriptional regulator [Caballeronia udeis]SAL20614.1 LysR family transcriptional regulator [Caballeronia udeis]